MLHRKHIENVELLKRAMLDDDLLDSDDLKDSDDEDVDSDEDVDDGSPVEAENETSSNIQSDAHVVPEDDEEPEPVAKSKKNKKSKKVHFNSWIKEHIMQKTLNNFIIGLSKEHIIPLIHYYVNLKCDSFCIIIIISW